MNDPTINPGQPNDAQLSESEDSLNGLKGGIKNALEKGDTLEKATQSFINGGYSIQEIEAAVKLLNLDPSQVQQLQQRAQNFTEVQNEIPLSRGQTISSNIIQTQPILNQQQGVSQQAVQTQPIKEKKSFFKKKKNTLVNKSLPRVRRQIKQENKQLPLAGQKPKAIPKWLIILLILLGTILVLAAGFLGVYWNQLFGPF